MKTIVHIGMSKSGSTALQNTLNRSGKYLLSKGVLYPKNPKGCPFNNHRLLVSSYRDYDDLPRHIRNRGIYTAANMDAKCREFLENIQIQMRRRQPDCLVLSSETLFHRILEENREQVRRTYDGLGPDLHFMAYLRRPSDHFLSSLQQGLRATHKIKAPRAPAFRIVLETYRKCFGRPVQVRQYHRDDLVNGSVIDDFSFHFLNEFGVKPQGLSQAQFSNESLSAESMDILAGFRARFFADRHNIPNIDTRRLILVLAEADRNCGAVRPKLKPGMGEMIDFSRNDPLWLRDELGVEFRDFDYATLEKNGAGKMPKKDFRLEELVEIDRTVQKEILESLLRSSWFRSNLAGCEWVRDVLKSGVGEMA